MRGKEREREKERQTEKDGGREKGGGGRWPERERDPKRAGKETARKRALHKKIMLMCNLFVKEDSLWRKHKNH